MRNGDTVFAGRWVMLALALLLLVALGLRYRGMAWAPLHPDEPVIAGWAQWTEQHTHISDRFYAGGFFQLVKPAVRLRTRLQEWGLAWQTFKGDPSAGPAAGSMILFLRTINVWLAVLTVLAIYAFARRVSGDPVAALGAAAFLALSRLHVDHSHYAETDIAMLLTLTVALALWSRVHDGGGRGWYLLAAAASGWAIGTKFTTGVLLFCLLSGAAVASVPVRGLRRVGRAVLLGVAGLVLCLAVVVYTNQGMLKWDWFIPRVTSGLSSVYAERSGLLNYSAADPRALWYMKWNTIGDELADIHWAWLALMLVGLGRALARPYRRFWPVTVMFPALYAAYCLWVAPWIRSQEFMTFLPVFAAWMTIGLREVTGWARRALPARPRTAVACVVLLVAVAMAGTALQSCRSTSRFAFTDPRLQALGWIATHAPLDEVTAYEKYTTPMERLFTRGVDIGQIERTPPKTVDRRELRYLVRNETSRGRGLSDPRTRVPYPQYTRNFEEFRSRAAKLCQWGPIGNPPYAFAGHRIEWWEVRHEPVAVAFDLSVARPVLLDRTPWVMVPMDGDLGATLGVWVDRTPRRLVVNGPASDHRVLYVVLQTVDRPAEVSVRFSGRRERVALGPYDVAVVPIRRLAWMPRFEEYDAIEVSARPVKHVSELPCYAEVALSPAEAAQRLLQKGYPDKALAFLKSEAAAGPEHAWLSYVCAVGADDWALADRVEPAARALLAQLEQARQLPPRQVMVNGYTAAALAQHRRIRLPVGRFDRETFRLSIPEQTLEVKRDKDPGARPRADWRLPVRLAAGRYRVAVTLLTPLRRAGDEPWTLEVGDSAAGPIQTVRLATGVRERVVREVQVGLESDFELRFESPAQGGVLKVVEVEILWGQDDLFRMERLELQKALIRHALHRGDAAGAEETLAAARRSVPDDFGLDRLELAWRKARGADAAELAPVARRILQTAPFDAAALAALAPLDAAASALWDGLRDGPGPALTLYPWFRLVRMGLHPATGRMECVFEALRDETPELKVRVWRRKNRRNAAYFEQPLSGRRLQRGERARIDLPPSPETGAYDGTWLTVESPPLWLSAPLTAPGLVKGRIPLQ